MPAPEPPANIAAIIAVVSGLLGLVVLPILFGPAALIAGFVGEHLARNGGRKLGRVAILGLILGALCTYLAVQRLGGL